MTPIEEKAKAYAEDVIDNASWSDIEFMIDRDLAIKDVEQAYLQGAKDQREMMLDRILADNEDVLKRLKD